CTSGACVPGPPPAACDGQCQVCTSTGDDTYLCDTAPDGTSCAADADGCTADQCTGGTCTAGGKPEGCEMPCDICTSTGATPFTCERPDGLLLSELVVTPTDGEFIESHNPTESAIPLGHVWISDFQSYYLVAAG